VILQRLRTIAQRFHSDCTAIAKRFRSDRGMVAGQFAAIAQRLQSDREEITQRYHSESVAPDFKAIVNINFIAIAKRSPIVK
jgi:hypothetical protein